MHKWPSSLLILVRKNIGISIYIELLSPTMTTSVIIMFIFATKCTSSTLRPVNKHVKVRKINGNITLKVTNLLAQLWSRKRSVFSSL